jgi:hypothetical protein
LCSLAVALLLPPLPLRAAESGEIVSVYSAVSPNYRRTPSGNSFIAETYAFGEGGLQAGVGRDETIDRLKFVDIARQISPSLAAQNYFPCDPKRPREANLLIMVYWGTTIGTDSTTSSSEYQLAQQFQPPPLVDLSPAPTGLGNTAMAAEPRESNRMSELQALTAIKYANDSALQQSLALSAMANRRRDHQDFQNAAVLGYASELERVRGYGMTALAQRRKDLIDEIEESRYFVVLIAYDFQALLRRGEKIRLWETRFSIRERRNDFGRQLTAMATSASRFFGQNSGGLVHKPLPDGKVELGELKSLGPER